MTQKTKKFLVACSLPFILFFLIFVGVLTYIHNHGSDDTKVKSDVILVLGAKLDLDGRFNPCLTARIKHGAVLYQQGWAPKVLIAAGEIKSDAQTIKDLALQFGIAEKDLLVETKSINTYENFVYSKEIMADNGANRAIIVTEKYHSPRADLIADKVGVTHTVSPVPKSVCADNPKYSIYYYLRETLAVMGYKLQGKI